MSALSCDDCSAPARYSLRHEAGIDLACGRHLARAAERALGPLGEEWAESGDSPLLDRVLSSPEWGEQDA